MGKKSEINHDLDTVFFQRIDTINSGYPESFSAYPKPLLFAAVDSSSIPLESMLSVSQDAVIYINIPFCLKKCSFCFIDIIECSDVDIYNRYTDSIIQEISTYAGKYNTTPIKSIYIGGGTPVVLGINNLKKIVNSIQSHFIIDIAAIWEIDATPTILTDGILKGLKELSIDTLNIGIQSTEKSVLRDIGREWQTNAYLDIIGEKIKKFGFRVHLDFIIGLPGETITTFTKQLDYLCITFKPSSFSINIYEETVYSPDFFSERKDLYPKDEYLSKIAHLLEMFLKNKYSLGREHTDYIHFFHQKKKNVIAFGAGAFGYISGYGMYKNVAVGTYLNDVFQRHFIPMSKYDEKLMFLMNNISCNGMSLEYMNVFGTQIKDDFPHILAQESAYISYGDNEKDYKFSFSNRREMQKIMIKYFSKNILDIYRILVKKKLSQIQDSFNTYHASR